MSSNKVIKFPTPKVLSNQIRQDMKTLGEALAKSYKDVDEFFEMLGEMEELIENTEAIYNDKLIALANLVGAENIEIEDLEFATNLSVKVSPDGTEYKLAIHAPESPEILFTPDFVLEPLPEDCLVLETAILPPPGGEEDE